MNMHEMRVSGICPGCGKTEIVLRTFDNDLSAGFQYCPYCDWSEYVNRGF
jgi:predicted RNA-binding Zn-ribbon protein involved in translation (DUF1610 family)